MLPLSGGDRPRQALVVMTANFITYSHKKQEKAGTVPGGFLAILSSLLTH